MNVTIGTFVVILKSLEYFWAYKMDTASTIVSYDYGKFHFFHSHLDFFLENLSSMIDEHTQRLHQDL